MLHPQAQNVSPWNRTQVHTRVRRFGALSRRPGRRPLAASSAAFVAPRAPPTYGLPITSPPSATATMSRACGSSTGSTPFSTYAARSAPGSASRAAPPATRAILSPSPGPSVTSWTRSRTSGSKNRRRKESQRVQRPTDRDPRRRTRRAHRRQRSPQGGHNVTVFKALPPPGGLMPYGIPEYPAALRQA